MIIESREWIDDRIEGGDVCIVGAGPAGLSVASKLVETGLSVLLVDAGPWMDQPGVELEGINSGFDYDLGGSRLAGIGGSARLWNVGSQSEGFRARMRPLDPIDFEETDTPAWPFAYEALAPYFEQCHVLIEAGRGSYDSKGSANEEAALEEVEFRFTPAAVFTKKLPLKLEQAGNVRFLVAARVSHFELDRPGRLRAVAFPRGTRRRIEIRATAFVLAAGGIRNASILLTSSEMGAPIEGHAHVGRYFMEHPHLNIGITAGTDRPLPNMDHPFGELRHVLTEQERILIAGARMAVLARKIELNPERQRTIERGPPSPGRRSLATIMDGVRRRRVPAHLFTHLGRAASLAWQGSGSEQFPASVLKDPLIMLTAMTEQKPSWNSRVGLSSHRDDQGLRIDVLEWQVDSADVKAIRATQQRVLSQLIDSGTLVYDPLCDLDPNTPEERKYGGGFHHMGTTRMGASPHVAVVDSDMKVFGVENLYVAGSSVFPSSGYANPTFTIVALALRLGQRLNSLLRPPQISS